MLAALLVLRSRSVACLITPRFRQTERFIPGYAGNTGSHGAEGNERSVHPAYAGNTPVALVTVNPDTVHPRLRGEHGLGVGGDDAVAGSSPLTRGTHRKRRRPSGHARFIPAYAGNTTQRSRGWGPGPVHPRLRGEHLAKHKGVPSAFGSSPLTRGTPSGLRYPRETHRFIPAYAGNTVASSAGFREIPVHPRLRGEHQYGLLVPG